MKRLCIAGIALAVAAFGQTPRAVLDQYCVGCHNDRLRTAGISFQTLDVAHPGQNAEIWEKVIQNVRSGMMPPPGLPRASRPVMDHFALDLETAIDQAALADPNPGRLGLHRLNRTEYANAVRDMLGLEIDSKAYLPPDESSHGFDNIGETLNISPALMEGYLRVAARVSRDAVGDPKAAPQTKTYHLSRSYTQREHVDGTPLGTRGGMAVQHIFPADGEYSFKVDFQMAEQGGIWGETMGPGEQIEIAIDGRRVALLDVDPTLNDNSPSLETPKIKVRAGEQTVSASFLERTEAPNGDLIQQHDRSIVDLSAGMTLGVTTQPHLKDLGVLGPYRVTTGEDTPSRRKIFICRPPSPNNELPCAKKIIANLLRQAYRRPVTDEDVEQFLPAFADGREGADFDMGIRTVLHTILAFPEFVFRFEYPPKGLPAETNYRISDLGIASRLSFFLWSSIPDEPLIELASQGKLKDPAVLEQQVKRMLRDSRSQALAKNFAEQWLGLRDLAGARPDVSLYPDFDENLAQSMLRETDLFFESIVSENRSVLDLLTANYTFVNERLARLYGIPNVSGTRFRRVTLTDPNRFGLLGQASILTATSTANRTSPVERGKWVLETLAGVRVPLPPPNTPLLKENVAGKVPQTVREKLEEHRKNEPCASCHKLMDPIGFSLENFDAVGAWRIHDSGAEIDSSGQMYEGTKLNGPTSLRQALLGRSDVFVQNFTAKLLMYALGRRLESYDMPAVRAIDREAEKQDDRFEAIVLGIVKSVPFQMSRLGAEK